MYASGAFPLAQNDDIIGVNKSYTIIGDETLLELARSHDLGYNEITLANPLLDPWIPNRGTSVRVPTQWILPDSARKGVVINLAEMRLYYYLNVGERRFVRTYPIGIGVDGSLTPMGSYRIGLKLKNPTWYVPKSIREEEPDRPAKVPPGPDNPLGGYALNLKGTSYFIHGTNEPYGIGRQVSHGCIRLYPEDIEILFNYMEPGTLVNIIYQPVKIGQRDGEVFVEVHPDYLEREGDLYYYATAMLRKNRLIERVDMNSLKRAIEEQRGVPVSISTTFEVSGEDLLSKTNAPSPAAIANN